MNIIQIVVLDFLMQFISLLLCFFPESRTIAFQPIASRMIAPRTNFPSYQLPPGQLPPGQLPPYQLPLVPIASMLQRITFFGRYSNTSYVIFLTMLFD